MNINKTLLIGAIGLKGVGKSTVLSLLAENISEDGVIPKCYNAKEPLSKLTEFIGDKGRVDFKQMTPYSIQLIPIPAQHHIVLVDNINDPLTCEKLLSLGMLLIRVNFNRYDNHIGRQSTIHRMPEESEKWQAATRCDLGITSFEEGMRRLGWEVKNLYGLIKEHAKWKGAIQ